MAETSDTVAHLSAMFMSGVGERCRTRLLLSPTLAAPLHSPSSFRAHKPEEDTGGRRGFPRSVNSRSIYALVDSGVAGNFIDERMIKLQNIPVGEGD
ncbi:hypothetical protein UPYG_G00231930 [Umbra pygmaea]|uniref:Uncharacterized protein n=1 Tax=Umbra pygmaea TaxID=75934 RepID=A0ABD0WVW8_UMBPY